MVANGLQPVPSQLHFCHFPLVHCIKGIGLIPEYCPLVKNGS
jgi:hypothetical protein